MSQTQRWLWTFTGLTGVDLDNNLEVQLPDGFLISPRTPQLSAALDEGYMGSMQKMSWTPRLDAFFCLRSECSLPRPEEMERFQDGLMALQIVKPVQTLGLIFQADDYGGCFHHTSVQERPPMFAGDWAAMRRFDPQLMDQSRAIMPKLLTRMETGSPEEKNSVILLQLALEHFHPLVKGLFAVMGLDALLELKPGEGRNDFKRKLCERLGESTLAFPDWNSPSIPPPKYTIADVALHLYTLRGKVAHGVDLRKAARDKNVPVDLTKMVELIEQLGPRPYAALLSEAAVYILCLALQKELEAAPGQATILAARTDG